MKNPLQNEKEQILLLSKGQLIGWGKGDVKNLITMANLALSDNLETRESLSTKEAERLVTYKWFETLVEKGHTVEVLSKFNSVIGHVHYHHVLKHSPTGLPYWRRFANADQMTSPEIAMAYGVAQMLAIGELKGLKRCELKTCRKFFIGRSNTKWCSQSCGSLHRVKQKRKRDKE